MIKSGMRGLVIGLFAMALMTGQSAQAEWVNRTDMNITATSDYVGDFSTVVTQLFDNDPGTAFASVDGTAAGYIQVRFPDSAKFAISKYELTARDHAVSLDRHMHNWTLRGSNDGFITEDVVVDTQTGIEFEQAEAKEFTFANTTRFEYYRFAITATGTGGAGTRFNMQEIDMFEDVAVEYGFVGQASSGFYVPGVPAEASVLITNYSGRIVQQVEFLIDGKSIGVATTAAADKYSVPWPLLAPGNYTLTANLTANDGDYPATPVNVAVGYDAGAGNGIATAVSTNGWGPPEDAFADTAFAYWCSAADHDINAEPAWLQYQFPNDDKWMIDSYTITPRDYENAANPTLQQTVFERTASAWTLEGSNDEAAWTVLDTRTDVMFADRFETKKFKVTTPGNYEYYRINITANRDLTGTNMQYQIGELDLLIDIRGQIEMTEPAEVLKGSVGEPVTVGAQVTGSSNTVTLVNFIVDGEIIASDSDIVDNAASATFTPTKPGTLRISAMATDDQGNVFFSSNAAFVALPYFVKPVGSGDMSGASWDNAITYDAVMPALGENATLYLHSGLYTMLALTVPVENNVEIFGGFLGTETSPEERSATFQADAPTTISGAHTFQIFDVLAAGSLLIDGVDLRDGNSTHAVGQPRGGAARATNAALTVRNSRIIDCYSPSRSGAFYTINTTTVFQNCVVTSNSADDSAAAILVNTGGSLLMEDCVISENITDGTQVGAVWANQTVATTITRTIFRNNTCTAEAGALWLAGNNGLVRDCTFTGNSSTQRGGAMFANAPNLRIEDSVFQNNMGEDGGALAVFGSSNFTLTNCLIADNSATGTLGGGAIYLSNTNATVTNNTITGNIALNLSDTATAGVALDNPGPSYWLNNIIEGHAGKAMYSNGVGLFDVTERGGTPSTTFSGDWGTTVTNLFDNNVTNNFNSLDNETVGYIQFDFANSEKHRVSHYTLRARDHAVGPERAPYSWTLRGSDDGFAAHDVVVDTVAGVNFLQGQVFGFLVANPGTYAAYRLDITATGIDGSGTEFDLCEIEFLNDQQPALNNALLANNLLFGNTVNADGPGITLSPTIAGTPTDTNITDPQAVAGFANKASGDYSLLRDSSAVNAGKQGIVFELADGTSVPVIAPALDSAGTMRDTMPDIGYLESPFGFTFTATVPGDGGSITLSPDMAEYPAGTTVTVEVVTNIGWEFLDWTGDVPVGQEAATSFSIVMDGNKSVSASFLQLTVYYNLAIVSDNGMVLTSPIGTSFEENTMVTLEATPNATYRFTGWTGNVPIGMESDNPLTITMDEDKAITATYEQITWTLSLNATNGIAIASPAGPTFIDGTTVSIVATPDVGYHFVSWTGDVPTGQEQATEVIVTMHAEKSLTAHFEADSVTLMVNATNGSVAVTPNQIEFLPNETASLLATPADGYKFSGWSDDRSGMDNPLAITLTTNTLITANFVELEVYNLTLTTTTGGSAAIVPAGTEFVEQTEVSITPTATEGYDFAGWTGDATGTSVPLTLTMDADKAIEATFVLRTYPLTLSATNGTAVASPDQAEYGHGTTVTVTATEAANYHFTGWTGNIPAGQEMVNPIIVTMDAVKTLAISFAIDTHPVVATAGQGGTVLRTPDQAEYDYGTTMSVTATPNVGFAFIGWTGDVPADQEMLTVVTLTIDTSKTLTASFRELPAADLFKVTYKGCTIDRGADEVRDMTVSGTSTKSSIKIQRMKKPPKSLNEVEGKFFYIENLRVISNLDITGEFGKFSSDAEIWSLTSTGNIKSITTKNANIGWISASSIASIKMTAFVDYPTTNKTAAISVMTTGAGTMKASFSGIVVENFVTNQQIVKSLTVASKAWKTPTKAKTYSLGGIGAQDRVMAQAAGLENIPVEDDSLVSAPTLTSISAKGAPITPDKIIGGLSKITVKGAVFKVGVTLASVEADLVTRLLISSTPMKSITAKAKKSGAVMIGGTIGTLADPMLMMVQLHGDLNTVTGQNIGATFWAGVSDDGPGYTNNIKKITAKGTLSGSAHVATEPKIKAGNQDDYATITMVQ